MDTEEFIGIFFLVYILKLHFMNPLPLFPGFISCPTILLSYVKILSVHMNYPIVWYYFIIFLWLSIFSAWHCHFLLWVIGGCYPSSPVSELLESLKHFFGLCLGIAIWYIDAGVGRFKRSWVGGFSHQRLHVCGKCLCFVFQNNCLNN